MGWVESGVAFLAGFRSLLGVRVRVAWREGGRKGARVLSVGPGLAMFSPFGGGFGSWSFVCAFIASRGTVTDL